MRFLVISAASRPRRTSRRSVFMLTGIDVVDDRQHQGAAVHHHALAAEAGAHEGDLLRRAAIEPVDQPDADRDQDRGDDDHER